MGIDELSSYSSKYSGDSKTWYDTYTNYYGVYTKEQVANVLFAKVQADNEDLKDGDPYYFYKAAGASSSDIDLYFEGTGYLEVKSKNKEGIETKGNLTFSGGTGDYVIYAEDDCLNTTTTSSSNKSARNTLTIDVNSLVAIVDSGEDSDEGDSIDSNGKLIINGGTIIAIAHPGQDAGLDSETGTYINGGTVIATGDMYDAISNESKQNFIVFSFKNAQTADTLITLLNENDETVMSYKTDRLYTNLVYSSANLKEGTYYLYKGGEIEGTQTNGFYTNITNYTKGTQQGYSMTGAQGGRMQGEGGERPTLPSGENQRDNSGRPTLPSGENQGENSERQVPPSDNNSDMRNPENMNASDFSATNKDFKVSGISNQFSGVADYTESTNDENKNSNEDSNSKDSNNENLNNKNSNNDNLINENVKDTTTANTILPQTGVVSIAVILIGIFGVLAVVFYSKNKNIKVK